MNPQGGKVFGALKVQQEEFLDSLNKEFLDDPKYNTDEELTGKLEIFKKKYMEFDLNAQGDIDIMALKRMLEKMGAAKTHLELKKMITEVTGGMSETICYRDFICMMLGKRSAILKICSPSEFEKFGHCTYLYILFLAMLSFHQAKQLIIQDGKREAFTRILMYEEKAREKEEKPAGPPPKKILADLP